MRDPHVVKLRYRIETIPTIKFTETELTHETHDFQIKLEQGKATFEPKVHFPSIEAARSIADPFLRAWELDVALRYGKKEITFLFEDAEMIDRNPPPPGSPNIVD